MLASEPFEGTQALFQAVQGELSVKPVQLVPAGAIAIRAQLGGQVLGLDDHGVHPCREGVERGIDAREGLHGSGGRCHELRRARSLAGIRSQRLGCATGGRAQRIEAAKALARAQQLLVLALVGRDRVDLGELELEQSELALARGCKLAHGIHALLQKPRLRKGLSARAQALGMLAVAQAVEDLELRSRKRELAMLVLAVEREQRPADLAQLADGDRASAQVGAGATVRADAAGEHELLRVRAQTLLETLAQRLGQVEDALDISLACSGAHDARPGAATEQQVERVREHGLARAGLAREHVQAGSQAQLGPLDQQQILYAKLLQHVRWSSSARGQIAAGASAAGSRALHAGRRDLPADRWASIIWVSAAGTDACPDVHSSANGMAASDPYPHSSRLPHGGVECFSPAALRARLEEEISRAERHGTQLSCLLLVIENLEEMTREHGAELREQTLDYVTQALRRELRRFDRVGRGIQAGVDSTGSLLIILPGADGPRAEIVARRALDRLRTIKVEARGTRWPLQVSVGLAAWREDVSVESLIARARAAIRSVNGEDVAHPPDAQDPPDPEPSRPAGAHGGMPPALGTAGPS